MARSLNIVNEKTYSTARDECLSHRFGFENSAHVCQLFNDGEKRQFSDLKKVEQFYDKSTHIHQKCNEKFIIAFCRTIALSILHSSKPNVFFVSYKLL